MSSSTHPQMNIDIERIRRQIGSTFVGTTQFITVCTTQSINFPSSIPMGNYQPLLLSKEVELKAKEKALKKNVLGPKQSRWK